ncbi:hypothetical protein MPSEU_001099600 [Mayamaea pseudoterrestris]|nr:hypothetical protein MPSEU_001099600 [Mayamaea pseudoterrestris]
MTSVPDETQAGIAAGRKHAMEDSKQSEIDDRQKRQKIEEQDAAEQKDNEQHNLQTNSHSLMIDEPLDKELHNESKEDPNGLEGTTIVLKEHGTTVSSLPVPPDTSHLHQGTTQNNSVNDDNSTINIFLNVSHGTSEMQYVPVKSTYSSDPLSTRAVAEPFVHYQDSEAYHSAAAFDPAPQPPNYYTFQTYLLIALLAVVVAYIGGQRPAAARLHQHIIPPSHYKYNDASCLPQLADMTLRDVLTNPKGFHLALAPSFFGFYGYFGMLAAWEETVDGQLLRDPTKLHSVAGASAGAMVAVLLAADVRPRKAAEFCASMTLRKFADPFGLLGMFKGHKFERLMENFLRAESPNHSLLLEDGIIPVAVSGFDLQTLSGKILRRGSMARAARASATFPFLFQPVHWSDKELNEHYVLIDGGISDIAGLHGLDGVQGDHFVVNLVVGTPWDTKVFHHEAAKVSGTRYLTISMQNLPQCGPWALANGFAAVDAASKAMTESIDLPVYMGKDENHYELHIDASSYWS